ncbi:MAG: formate dehydrogenase accessory sulfurtransferase FdhD [Actinomycetota bacterium]|nr:formate dehydrogenase accessory sulfurtransferase FdhD [Actinomycetota bacterium]
MTEETEKLPITAAVLAGGRSQRMGVDKTLLEIEGIPMVSRVVSAMGEICRNVMVVTTRPQAAAEAGLPEGVLIVTDEVDHLGPLGGIVTGLAQARDEWLLVVAADMPWVTSAVVLELWKRRDGADVVVPNDGKGLEPLLALYRVKTVLSVARETLDAGERRPVAPFARLKVTEVSSDELRLVDPDLKSLININTPHDLDRTTSGETESETTVRMHVVEVGTRRVRGMPSEKPITVYLNGVEMVNAQATPSDLEDMAVGFLHVEGFLTDRDRLGCIEVDARRGMVFVTSDEETPVSMRGRKRYVTSGCGRGVTFTSAGHLTGVDPVESGLSITAESVYDMMGQMARGAERYRETGGMHACAIGMGGTIAFMREDVGRHNALDKVLGAAWRDGATLDHAVLLTSGRISSEMAVKAMRAGVPIVVSRTAVTDLAAEVASELGVTLIGYARGGKLVIYTNAWRIREGGSV